MSGLPGGARVEPLESVEEHAPEGWTVRSLEDADWALARIAECERQADENSRALAAAVGRLKRSIAQLEERTKGLNAALEQRAAYFRGQLELYARDNRETLLVGKKKSRSLPHGSFGWRRTGGQPFVADAGALMQWAKEQPPETGFLELVESMSWALIKRHCKESGELPPGVELEPEVEVFTVDAVSMEASDGE